MKSSLRRGIILGILFVAIYYLGESSWLNGIVSRVSGNPTTFHLLKVIPLFSIGFLSEIIKR